MPESDQPSIEMGNPIELSANWAELSTNLASIAVNGIAALLGNPGSIGATLVSLGALPSSFEFKRDPSRQLWQLFWLALGWALNQVRVADEDNQKVIVDLISKEIADIRSGPKSNELLFAPVDVLDRPTRLPIYIEIRNRVAKQRESFGSPASESEDQFSARIDAAFASAFFVVISRNVERFSELIALLKAPGIKANAFTLQWKAYRQKLIHDFEVLPMFGQNERKISLAQAYVPLRCRWELNSDEEDRTYPQTKFALLDEVLAEWLSAPCSLEESVKLIGGGPGSGKSTSIRRLARVVANDTSIRPLLVPLQHIDLQGHLRDAINAYFTDRTDGSFTSPPLARDAVEDGPPLLLLFDGLDEIARPGEGADEIANLFITKLDQLQSSLQGDSAKSVKIIVSGRLPSFQAARKFKGALGSSALEVFGFAPAKRGQNGEIYEDDLAALDQRPDWWNRISPLFGLPIQVPEALNDPRLEDVTNEPLLSYLLVLSGLAVDKWEEAAENRNLIFQRLIDEVWRRGWGDASKDKNRQGPGRHLSKDQFNELMETIAIAAWLGGDTRVASDEMFHKAIGLTNSQGAWDEFRKDGGDDVANLAMNFYLKASETSRRGFEFTHKSFGDYLAARAIIGIARGVTELFPRYPDLALKGWLDATYSGVMTTEILGYLRDEYRLGCAKGEKGRKDLSEINERMIGMCRLSVKEGLPAQNISSPNWRTIANFQKNSEISLWATMNASLLAIGEVGLNRIVDVGFSEDKLLLKDFLVRLSIGGDASTVIGSCLGMLDARGSDLFGLDLSQTDFTGGILKGANFNGTHLMGSRLDNCQLERSLFERANLDDATFYGSVFEETNFCDARLNDCDIFSDTRGSVLLSRRSILDIPLDIEVPADRVSMRRLHRESDRGAWLTKARRAEKFSKDFDQAHRLIREPKLEL